MGIDDPVTRPLKAYAFDPSAGKLVGNELTMQVRHQRLQPGPVVSDGARDAIAVVDYDGANRTYYTPVDLDAPRVLIRGGLPPDDHQQMVYAVVTDTIQLFTVQGKKLLFAGDAQGGNWEYWMFGGTPTKAPSLDQSREGG
jgi:hypothetical protein